MPLVPAAASKSPVYQARLINLRGDDLLLGNFETERAARDCVTAWRDKHGNNNTAVVVCLDPACFRSFFVRQPSDLS